MEHSIEDGIISSNQSLVLQRISKISAGNYTCTAYNSEGSGLSNHVNLNIKCKFCYNVLLRICYNIIIGLERKFNNIHLFR